MIVQDAFYVPDSIAVKLATGEMMRFGSVVRWAEGPNKGAIVEHLDSVDLTRSFSTAMQQSMQQSMNSTQNSSQSFFSEHKTGIIIGASVGGVVGIGIGIAIYRRKRKQKRINEAFENFFEAMREGEMTVEIIDELDDVLDDLDKVKMTGQELRRLLSYVRKYTLELAQINGVSTADIKTTGDNIIDFRAYLDKERRILEAA